MVHHRAWLACVALGAASLCIGPSAMARGPALGVVVAGVKAKLRAGADLKLRARPRWHGPKAEMEYQWKSISGPPIPYDVGTSSPELHIPSKLLEQGERYHLRVRITAHYRDPDLEPPEQTAVATSEVKIAVNAPPAGGACKLKVRWIGRAQAEVRIEATGWKDEDPLQYRYFIVRNGRSALLYSWTRLTSYRAVTIARPGDELQARCAVRDDLGDGAEARSQKITRTAAE